MPVFDWTRSRLDQPLYDGSNALVYYKEDVDKMDPTKMTLPGWDASYTPDEISGLVDAYKELGEEGLWKNVGDIAISLETLPKTAEYFEVDTNTELKRLIIHGILHLNGMDHGEEHIEKGVVPTDEMLILQENLLADLSDEKIIG